MGNNKTPMKIQIFSILDLKAEAYQQPFFTTNNATAIRMLQNELQREGSNFAKYPEDYNLFAIGDFNDVNALLTPRIPESLGNAMQMNALIKEIENNE